MHTRFPFGAATVAVLATTMASRLDQRASAAPPLAAAAAAAETAAKLEQLEFEQRERRRKEAEAMSDWAKKLMGQWAPPAITMESLASGAAALDGLLGTLTAKAAGGTGGTGEAAESRRPHGLDGLLSRLGRPSPTTPTGREPQADIAEGTAQVGSASHLETSDEPDTSRDHASLLNQRRNRPRWFHPASGGETTRQQADVVHD